MPNLLKLVTKSATNFWLGNFCPLINEIKEIIRNVDMKIILTTEWSLSKVWNGIWGNILVYYIHFSYGWPHINVFFCIFVTLTFPLGNMVQNASWTWTRTSFFTAFIFNAKYFMLSRNLSFNSKVVPLKPSHWKFQV